MHSIFYDLETTGLDPEFDQIIQFGAMVVDENLKVIKEKEVRIRLRPDVVPNPDALLVTRSNPTQLTVDGVTEYEGLNEIFQLVNEKPVRLIGYNSDAFDDNFLRWGFYRNLLDPYLHTYKDSAHTADIYSLVIFCSVFKPEALEWEMKEDGKANLRLEALMRANDFVDSTKAHDALVDVQATLELARKIRRFSPSLYDRFLRRSQAYYEKDDVADVAFKSEVLLVGKFFGRERNYQALGRLVSTEKKQCVFLNLSERRFSEVSEAKEIPLVFKKWGDSTLAMTNTEIASLDEISRRIALENLEFLKDRPDFFEWVRSRHQKGFPTRENLDPDSKLYAEFPPFGQPLYLRFHQTTEKEELIPQMPEPYRTLATRILWRSFDRTDLQGKPDPNQTNTKGVQRFSKEEALERLKQLTQQGSHDPERLNELVRWYEAR